MFVQNKYIDYFYLLFLGYSCSNKIYSRARDAQVIFIFISFANIYGYFFSIPSITVHPSKKFFCGQSMDNSIVTYTCGEKVSHQKKKTFRGHNNSGYACQVSFSPNGQFLCSGDGAGKLHFWDWKTTKVFIIHNIYCFDVFTYTS